MGEGVGEGMGEMGMGVVGEGRKKKGKRKPHTCQRDLKIAGASPACQVPVLSHLV